MSLIDSNENVNGKRIEINIMFEIYNFASFICFVQSKPNEWFEFVRNRSTQRIKFQEIEREIRPFFDANSVELYFLIS